MNKFTLLVLLAIATGVNAGAEIKLPSVIADNMVLQQQTSVKLWGKATPGDKITATPSWDRQPVITTAQADSSWIVTLTTPAAGGPYSIDLNDGTNTTTLSNLLIGEVWLCSGQSNMEMPMRGFERQPLQGGNEMIARAKKRVPIRMFITDSHDGSWVRQSSKTPQDDMHGRWLENTPENVAVTSAVAYYFADYLQDVLEVPVGIMVTSLGGSRIEPWISREAMTQMYPDIDLSFLDNDDPVKSAHNDPCVLFNAKINPLTNYGIRGFLWYQGESNRDNADQYAGLMGALATDWRVRFGGGDKMPFLFVEIAPFDYEGADGISAALLREAQADASRTIPNSGIASTIDAGNYNFIHPVDKATVGQRLAWLALSDTYGITGIASHSPQYDRHEIIGDKIRVFVTETPNNIAPMWTSLAGFEIAGDDGIFHPAKAEIIDSPTCIVVSSPEVTKPKHVRYAFHNTPLHSVYSGFGLPLLPFRTDR